MYKKMLAPLDGSELSECSLEHVRAVATGCQVPEIVLLRVIEPIHEPLEDEGASDDWRRSVRERAQAVAEGYLAKVANSLKKEGIAAQSIIASGRPDEVILDYASKNQVNLIIMSTHGRSGVSRWVFGSIADSVLRYSTVPVLMVSPAGCRTG